MRALQDVWSQLYPQRAAGGRAALTGFLYQFELFLLELTRRWLELAEQNAGAADYSHFVASVESVSDFAFAKTDGLIIASQCKITLRSGALADALSEFLTVLTAAKSGCPQLVDRIRFRVFTSRIELSDVRRGIENWAQRTNRDESLASHVAKYVQVLEQSTPAQDLIGLLVNHFACPEPLGYLSKWTGRLTRAVENEKVLEHIASEIWEELRSLQIASRIAVQNRLYIWQDEDRPPTGTPKGDVLIGQRPSVRHLREGFFAPRRRLYADLAEELRSWLTQASGDRLRMFWLAGRSGSGKSVALLHLLASLHSDGTGPIIWLGHRVNQLSDAFSASLRLSLPQSSPIIGVDDPFVPGDEQELARQWERVFSIFHPHQQIGTNTRTPVFIVCGPTEQAHAYQEHFGDELDLRIMVLASYAAGAGRGVQEYL